MSMPSVILPEVIDTKALNCFILTNHGVQFVDSKTKHGAYLHAANRIAEEAPRTQIIKMEWD